MYCVRSLLNSSVINCKTTRIIVIQLRRFEHNHKYILDMDKAYLKFTDTCDEFQMNFHYKNKNINFDRTFNFCRKVSEKLEAFLNRVNANVEKAIGKKIKKLKTNKEELTVKCELLTDNNLVDINLTCKEVFNRNNLILRILGMDYKIITNSPWIESVNLPTVMLACYPVYPVKFQSSFVDKNLSEFIWYKSKDQREWLPVGHGFIFEPTNNEVNNYLKLSCIPKNKSLVGPLTEVVSKGTVQASPGVCPFEIRHLLTVNKNRGQYTRVVTYNILADFYCDSEFSRTVLFPYCPPYALHIDYRKLLFVRELKGYAADVMCLQEVDQKVYLNDLQPVFSTLGFDSEFLLKGGQVVEGLAIFYDRNRFDLIDRDGLIFAENLHNDAFKSIWQVITKNKSLKLRISTRTTAIQSVLLKSTELSDKYILVANTHLYFHPDADHIRLLQAGLAIKYIEDKKSKFEKALKCKISVIFCGDFNSTPKCGIYQLYTTGTVTEDNADWSSNENEAVKGFRLTQNLKLASACGTPKYTNYTAGFKDCLDYIFYDTESFTVAEVLPIPEEEILKQHIALPSVVFPSDHISLASILSWK